MTFEIDRTAAVSNWWTGDEIAESIARVRPYTMVRDGALRDLALQVRAVLAYGIRGDFVECGVWRGGAAFLVADCLRKAGIHDRRVWLFDSFEGLPAPQPIDGRAVAEYAENPNSRWYFNNCEASLEHVQQAAADLGLNAHVRFVKGWFDQSLPAHRHSIGPISLLRLDCDLYESVRCCLDNLYDLVSPNGFVVLDDYFTFDGAAVAVHEFMGSRQLAHRIEGVTSAEDGYAGYRCALFRKGGTNWNDTREWLERIDNAADEIERQLPAPREFILVDQGELVAVHQRMKPGRPLIERGGQDWGPPGNGLAAIQALEQHRRAGISDLVFVWSAFWWQDEYPELATHLLSRYRLVQHSPNTLIFDLR